MRLTSPAGAELPTREGPSRRRVASCSGRSELGGQREVSRYETGGATWFAGAAESQVDRNLRRKTGSSMASRTRGPGQRRVRLCLDGGRWLRAGVEDPSEEGTVKPPHNEAGQGGSTSEAAFEEGGLDIDGGVGEKTRSPVERPSTREGRCPPREVVARRRLSSGLRRAHATDPTTRPRPISARCPRPAPTGLLRRSVCRHVSFPPPERKHTLPWMELDQSSRPS